MSEHSPQPARETFWRKQLEAWRTSGQAQQAFCKRRSLSYSQFQYWRRKLGSQSDAQERASRRTGFVAVRPMAADEGSDLTVVLPGGAEIRGIRADNVALVERLLGLSS